MNNQDFLSVCVRTIHQLLPNQQMGLTSNVLKTIQTSSRIPLQGSRLYHHNVTSLFVSGHVRIPKRKLIVFNNMVE